MAPRSPRQPDDPPTLTFAPETDPLYHEDGDGVFRRFALDETIALATSLLTRGFTPEECGRYFPDEPGMLRYKISLFPTSPCFAKACRRDHLEA